MYTFVTFAPQIRTLTVWLQPAGLHLETSDLQTYIGTPTLPYIGHPLHGCATGQLRDLSSRSGIPWRTNCAAAARDHEVVKIWANVPHTRIRPTLAASCWLGVV